MINFKKIFSVVVSLCLGLFQGNAASAKDIISWHANNDDITWHNMPEVEYTVTQSGPTLVYSDSPEMVYKPGLLYRDKVKGPVRLFFHHVNATNSDKKLAVMVKHNNVRGLEYQITKMGICEPTHYWLKGGKDAERDYFVKKVKRAPQKLGYSQSAELLSGKGVILEPNQLVTGIIDLDFNKEAEITVLMCEPKADIRLFNERTKVEPMDEHPLRGTFENADWNYQVKGPINLAKKETKMLCMAYRGHFAKGTDKTTGLPAEDYGNYGVVYKVDFEVADKNKLKFYFAPLGGCFAGIGIFERNGKAEYVELPADRVDYGDLGEEWLQLGVLEPGKYSFTWAPPGSGNLPVSLVWEGVR